MIERIQEIIAALKKEVFFEELLTVFDVQAQQTGKQSIALSGKVLEQENLALLSKKLHESFPNLTIDDSRVNVLLNEQTPILRVNKNLTSMHRGKSFQSELMTQMLWGDPIAVLVDEGEWILGRDMLDGYICYTYKPYLGDFAYREPTHIVHATATLLYDTPDRGQLLTRLLGGTQVAVLEEKGEMVRVSANYDGWISKAGLAALADLPKEEEAQRQLVCQNARSLIGMPYLWGGTSPLGIDCSGLVQWSYRLAGIQTPRDAHMQLLPEQCVDTPFLPGDVVLYGEPGTDGKSDISHASLSLGGWTIIHSSRSRNGVYIDDVQQNEWMRENFAAAVRYIGK